MSRREQLEEMLQAAPDDVFLKYAVAMAYKNEGNAQAASERFEQVISQHPDYIAAYFQQGQLLAEEGLVEPARGVLERGIDAARRTGDAHAAMEMSEFLETVA